MGLAAYSLVVWPILTAAIASAVVIWRSPVALIRWIGGIPPGDILEPLSRAWRRSGRFLVAHLQNSGIASLSASADRSAASGQVSSTGRWLNLETAVDRFDRYARH